MIEYEYVCINIFSNLDIEMLIRCSVSTRSNICTWDHADVWCIDNQGPLLQMRLASFLNAFSGLARFLERKLLSLLLLLLWVSLNCLFLIITICGIIISIVYRYINFLWLFLWSKLQDPRPWNTETSQAFVVRKSCMQEGDQGDRLKWKIIWKLGSEVSFKNCTWFDNR